MLDFSKSWVEGTVLNCANTFTIDCLNPNVTLLAPTCAPWILNNPVIHVAWRFITITNNEDCMINRCTASSSIRKNPTWVLLEVLSTGGEWYGDGLLSSSSLESTNWVSSHLNESFYLYIGGSTWIVLASSLNSSVWVSGLKFSKVGFKVDESARLPATIAARASLNTINELLLREGEKLFSANLVDTLKGKGPFTVKQLFLE